MIPTYMSPAQNFLLIPNHISNLTYSKQISWTFFHNLLLPYSSPVQSGANSSFQLLRPKTLKPFLDSSLSYLTINLSGNFMFNFQILSRTQPHLTTSSDTAMVQATLISHLDYCWNLLLVSLLPQRILYRAARVTVKTKILSCHASAQNSTMTG